MNLIAVLEVIIIVCYMIRNSCLFMAFSLCLSYFLNIFFKYSTPLEYLEESHLSLFILFLALNLVWAVTNLGKILGDESE